MGQPLLSFPFFLYFRNIFNMSSKESSSNITMLRQTPLVNRYYWLIKDMSKFHVTNSLESPEFVFKTYSGIEEKFKFKLQCYDSDDDNTDSDADNHDDFDLVVNISIDYEFPSERKFIVVRSIADKNGKTICSEEISTTTVKAHDKLQKKYYLIDDFDIKCMCYENKLMVIDVSIIDITKERDAITTLCKSNHNRNVSLPKVLDHFAKFYETKDLCDFVLEVEDKEYPVHKVVLAATSPVFAALFIHEKKDVSKSLKITDVSKETIQEMLRYMYTGQAINLKNIAVELLKIAHKYNIDGLIKLCADHLKSKININNVLHMLALAMKYNLDDLKLETHIFFMTNPKAILDGEEFNNFMNSFAFSFDTLL